MVVVEVAVPKPVHVRHLEEPPLTRDESRLLLVPARTPMLAQAVVLDEARHRRVVSVGVLYEEVGLLARLPFTVLRRDGLDRHPGGTEGQTVDR